MSRETGRSGKPLLIRIAVAIVLCALVAGCFYWYKDKEAARKADAAVAGIEEIVPGISDGSGSMNGASSAELAAINIEGADVVGILRIPSLDIDAPVAAKDADEKYFAYIEEGSPVDRGFRIYGKQSGLFRSLAGLMPGDNVSFTDVYGTTYEYKVTTQYHLKNWDEGDNDLLLCYRTDSDTVFTVGCEGAE